MMPSPFETQFAAAVGALYEGAFGLSASYQAPDGSAAVTTGADGNPLTIRVHRNEARQTQGGAKPGTQAELQTAEVIVRQSQLAKVVQGGRFAVEGNEVWTIETTPTLKNGQHYCTCSRGGTRRLMPRREQS